MHLRTTYLLTETLISVAINTILSVGFVMLVFHGRAVIPVAGLHGVVADMAPQTFMVTLMSFLVPSVLTRRRLAAGSLSWHEAGAPAARYNIFVWAGFVAFVGALLVVGVSWLVLPALLPSGIRFTSLLLSKAAFGAALAAVVTSWAVRKALR